MGTTDRCRLEMRGVLEAWSSGLILVEVRVDAKSRCSLAIAERWTHTRIASHAQSRLDLLPHAGGTSCLSAFLPCPTAQFFVLAACNRRSPPPATAPSLSQVSTTKRHHCTSEFPTSLDPKYTSRAAAQPEQ